MNRLTIWAAFFCSGAAGLIFEILWFRQFAWLLGNTVWSASAVLAAFMAGLCLGYGLALRFRPAARQAVRTYIAIELVVAITGLLLVMLIPMLPAWLADAGQSPRFLIVWLLMLIPTTAMGVTLPLLVRALSDSEKKVTVIGGLYGWNTLGAVLGVLIAEHALIPLLGLSRSAVIASGFNLLAAILVLPLAKGKLTRESIAKAEVQPSIVVGNSVQTTRQLTWFGLMLVASVAGFLVMVAEVAGFRLLLLYLRGSSEAFAWMLATVLAGLGVGALLAQRYPFSCPVRMSQALLCMGLFLALGYVATAAIASVESAVPVLWLLLPAVLFLPLAIFSGWLLPALVGWYQQSLKDESRAAAALFLVNTAGAAVGALLAGLVLLPLLGVERTLLLAAVLAWGMAAVVSRLGKEPRADVLWLGASLLAMGCAVSLWLVAPVFWHQHLQYSTKVFLAQKNVSRVAVREGLNETAQLLRRDFLGSPIAWRLVTNVHSMSNTERDSRRYMKLYVWLPRVLAQDMESALLISYGTGSTARAMTDDVGLQQIDIVDPSEAVLSLSPIVHGAADPLQDQRVEIHIEDGRHYLQTTTRRYDLITGEPPPPRLAGIVNLYSAEYFALMYDRLNPGGWASYWLPVDQLSVESSKSIVQAFCLSFTDCSLWAGSNYNWMLVGSRDATTAIQPDGLQRLWGSAQQAELQATGLEHPALLGASFLADAAQLSNWVENSLPLRDNYPGRLQAEAADESDLRAYQAWSDPLLTRQRFSESSWVKRRWPRQLAAETLEAFDLQPILNNEIPVSQRPWFSASLAGQLLDDESLNRYRIPALWLLGSGVDELRLAMRPSQAEDNRAVFHRAAFALVNEQPQSALALLSKLSVGGANAQLPMAVLAACRAGQQQLAQQWLSESEVKIQATPSEKILEMLGCQ